jgi:hypothetical protein
LPTRYPITRWGSEQPIQELEAVAETMQEAEAVAKVIEEAVEARVIAEAEH